MFSYDVSNKVIDIFFFIVCILQELSTTFDMVIGQY